MAINTSQPIGFTTVITGSVTAQTEDGITRILAVGDAVYANETITTGDASIAAIDFVDGSRLDLGRDSTLVLDTEVFDPTGFEGQEEALASIEAVQQAILAGEDPTALLEAAAAGPAAGDAGAEGGHEFVQIGLTGQQTTPESGFETTGLSAEFLVPPPAEELTPEEAVVLPTLSITDDTQYEPNYRQEEGPVKAVFTVFLSEPSDQIVTVDFALAEGTAVTGGSWGDGTNDYEGVPNGQIIFQPGVTAHTIEVEIFGDYVFENSEQFFVNLSSPTNATIADGQGVGTILDVNYEPEIGPEEGVVHESALPDGSGSGAVVANGWLDISSINPIAAVRVGGVDVTEQGTTTPIPGANGGELSIEYLFGGYKWTYTLLDNTQHQQPVNDASILDQFDLEVEDLDGDVDTNTLTITVMDDLPDADDDGPVDVAEDTPTPINVAVNDVDGADDVDWSDGAKVFVATGAANGTAVYNNDGTFTYTPDAGFDGADSFSYTITDNDGDTSTATVTVNVAEDSEPTIGPESGTVHESALSDGSGGGALVQSGTFDITTDNDSLAVFTINGDDVLGGGTVFGAHGTLVVTETSGVYGWEYTLTDNTLAHGPQGPDTVLDDFTLSIVDSDGDPAGDTLSITVVDDLPDADDDGPFTVAEETPTVVDVDDNDTEGADGVDWSDPNKVYIAAGDGPSHGTVVYQGNGEFLYTPEAGYDGVNDSFIYTIKDADGDTSTATVTLEIQPPMVEVLDGTIITNTNQLNQFGVLTYIDMDHPHNAYAKLISLDEQGQEGNVNADTGFAIDPEHHFAVSVEVSTSNTGDDIRLTAMDLEGVVIHDQGTTFLNADNDGGHKPFALTSVIHPANGNGGQLEQPETFSVDGDSTKVKGVETPNDDVLFNRTPNVDVEYLFGDEGNDTLNGNGDTDFLHGGAGTDTLNAGSGNDVLVYDEIDATIDGGDGFDVLRIDGDAEPTAANVTNIEMLLVTDEAFPADPYGVTPDPDGENGFTVTLALSDVLDMTGTGDPDPASQFHTDGNTLYVRGNEGDSLQLETGWTRVSSGDESDFVLFQATDSSSTTASLFVEAEVNVLVGDDLYVNGDLVMP